MSEENATPQLDLAKGRTIPMSEKNSTFFLTCRRITADDWKKYYATIIVKASNSSEGLVNERDYETSYLTLVDLVLEHAEGYTVDNGAPLESLENWKQRVPLRHRLMLGRVLANTSASQEGDNLVIHAEGEAVYLDAPWSTECCAHGEDKNNGKLQNFTGLKHVLRTPTEQQFKRFSSEASRSTLVGGPRTGTTIYRSVSSILAELYDELVIAVDDAYVVNGAPLTTREQIIAEMDYDHKVTAAQAVFRPQNVVTVAEGDDAE